ncbi:extracellular solute-binding protein [Paenibacillus sp. Soil522]|uniref:extracellular solute-binding protein n=1 Tax=Paenibacillus sp. Soil522 TaxID=1736388 RepID=UPI0006FFC698|nr:extracellular solute-binding protein [Paenibacillus sp. Soil522]KRE48746.1 hypothetical protein ASG81_05970 [Paenibacillus sp. Soil522]
MKNRKNIWSAIACIVLSMFLLVTGCSGNNGNTGNTPKVTSPAQDKEEPIEITIANVADIPKTDDNFAVKYLEEKFNVKIKTVRFESASWKEQINVMLASNEIPDIFPSPSGEGDMVQWANQGIIGSISVEDIRQYMPKYVADFEAVAPNAWDVGTYQSKNWGVPRVWDAGATGFTPAYNGDWLEAIGFSEPPKTLTEFEDMLTKFTFDDPDKNGKDDTHGMTGRGKDFTPSMFSPVFGAFGVAPYQFKVGADGKLVNGAITEETRQTLKLLNKWYKAGIIDPEFITDTNGEIQQKFVSGKTGIVDTGMWHHLFADGYFGKISIDQGRKLVVGTALTGPNGDSYVVANGALQAPLMFGIDVEKNEKKRIKILQMLEFMATDTEGYMTTVFGEEGVSYTMDGDVAVWTEAYSDGDKRTELGIGGFYNPFVQKVSSMMKHHLSTEKIAFRDKVTSGVKVLTDALGPAVLESKTQYDTVVKPLQDQYFVKAISGELDTDKSFDDFVEQWLKTGGQAYTDEANKLYAERNAK